MTRLKMDEFDISLRETRVALYEQEQKWRSRKGKTDLDGGKRELWF